MKNRQIAWLSPLLLLLLAASLAGQERLFETEYLPLAVGTTWHYRTGDHEVKIRVVKHETVELEKNKEKQKIVAARLEVTGADRSLTERIAVLADGIYRFSAAGKELNPPLPILKLPAKKGDSWQYESSSDGEKITGKFTVDVETIEVPAGKFNTLTAKSEDLQVGNQKLELQYWFAPKYGIVKQRVKVGTFDVVLELEKFEKGGK